MTFIRHTLPNGLRLVAQPMNHLQSISVGVWVQTGAVKERAGEEGLSHFIEHMLFKGTEKRSARQIAQEMDSIGANINAYTAREYTCFYIKATAKHMDLALEMLADLLFHAKLDPEEMAKEKGVVVEEILMALDSPEDVAHEALGQAVFGAHPYGKNILGSKESVTAFQEADLGAYMARHYGPGNMVLSVAGNFEEAALLDKVNAHFAPAENLSPPVGFPSTPPRPSKRVLVNYKDIEQAHLLFAMPGYSNMHPRYFPLAVLNNALGGYMSSRLFQKIREDRGLAYSVYSYSSGYHDCGSTSIYVGTGQKQAREVMELVLEELRNLRQEGLGAEEFQRSKEQLKGSLILAGEGSGARMSSMGRMAILFDALRDEAEILALLDKVTMEDTREVAADILDESSWCASFVGPDVEALEGLADLW